MNFKRKGPVNTTFRQFSEKLVLNNTQEILWPIFEYKFFFFHQCREKFQILIKLTVIVKSIFMKINKSLTKMFINNVEKGEKWWKRFKIVDSFTISCKHCFSTLLYINRNNNYYRGHRLIAPRLIRFTILSLL